MRIALCGGALSAAAKHCRALANILPTREPAFVGTHVLSENVERFPRDDVIFLTGNEGGSRHHLSFGDSRDLFADHEA